VTELHARVATWVSEGADTELPRDLAIHAFSCDECLALAAGLDALHAVDVGAAPEPPTVSAGRSIQPAGLRVARAAAGLASIGLLAAAIVVGSGLLRPAPAGIAGGPVTPSPSASIAEGVLGGVPETPSTEPSETAAPSATDAPEPSPSPAATAVPFLPAPLPTPTPVVVPPAGTPRPTPAPTSAPPSPTPAPTAAPTATPPPPSPSIRPTIPPPPSATP
jgi:hypothetical protein